MAKPRIAETSPIQPLAVESERSEPPEAVTLPSASHAAPTPPLDDDGPAPVMPTIDWYLSAKRCVVAPFRADRPTLVGYLAVLHVATQLADADGNVAVHSLASAFPGGYAITAIEQLRLEGYLQTTENRMGARIVRTPLGPWPKGSTR